jgi:predicted amidohydrolase
MAIIGLVFLGVWVTAVIYGGKADRIAAARAASTQVDAGSQSEHPRGDG